MSVERGDEEFEAMFDSAFPLAQRVAYRIVGDPWAAEDIAAEAFVRLYAHWERLREEPGRVGWLLRVTGNLAIDTVRRRPPPLQPARTLEPQDAAVCASPCLPPSAPCRAGSGVSSCCATWPT